MCSFEWLGGRALSRIAGALLAVTLVACVVSAGAQAQQPAGKDDPGGVATVPLVQVRGLRFSSQPDYSRVVLDLGAGVAYSVGRLSDPERLYIDLFDTKIDPGLKNRQIDVRHSDVNRIRIAMNSDSVTRLVVDLNSDVQHSVFVLADPPRLVVDLKARSGAWKVAEAVLRPADVPLAEPALSLNASAEAETRPAESSSKLSPAASRRSPARKFTRPETLAAEASPPATFTASTLASTAPVGTIPVPKAVLAADSPPPPKPVKPVERQRTLRIFRVSQPPRLEDFLTHASPQADAVVTDFRQREPGDGTPISQKTKAYLSYDDKNLYVVFVCEDESGKVRGHMAKREEISEDDQVAVYLDSFHDGRHAYQFAANPLGLQLDGILTEGQKTDYSFDTVWHSEGRLTESGFTVWMAIPFKSLRFSGAPNQTWGIALGRTVLRNNENSYWPVITRRVAGFINQMAALEGLDHISAGHNVQFIPYSIFGRSRFLDSQVPAFRSQNEGRAGLDTKVVLRDAFTFDITVNPDFSQVESDEPQVTVNQRFEVRFPEKRPFFLENAGFFQTPINLFFSRRIINPQFGARLTGKIGQWALAGLLMDDRAAGRLLPDADRLHGARAGVEVVRVQREFGVQSTVGLLATSRDFGPSSNRVFALDTRLKLNPNWTFTGQLMRSYTRNLDGTRASGPGYLAEIDHSGQHFVYSGSYLDLSPDFHSQLGFVPRVDVRETAHFGSYTWRPKDRSVLSFGPSVSTLMNWDRQGRMQDRLVDAKFEMEFAKQTTLKIGRFEAFELFQEQGFHKGSNYLSLYAAWWKWLALSASYIRGTDINYSPAKGLAPFLANSTGGSFTLTLRPTQRARFDEIYFYSRLDTRNSSAPVLGGITPSIFNNHILRSKLNYQFTRRLSLRGILDYYALLPNISLINTERTKIITGDVLLTYLINPGTALYAGCTDQYENLAIRLSAEPMLRSTNSPSTSVGRQCFVKLTYLVHF